MPNIIDTQQLQATAQVAKSYILEQDTANVTTIINSLQQGGGSAPAADVSIDPTVRFFDATDALEIENNRQIFLSIERGTTKQIVVTGTGKIDVVGSFAEVLDVTLDGRTLSISPASSISAGLYTFNIEITDSETETVTSYRVWVNLR